MTREIPVTRAEDIFDDLAELQELINTVRAMVESAQFTITEASNLPSIQDWQLRSIERGLMQGIAEDLQFQLSEYY